MQPEQRRRRPSLEERAFDLPPPFRAVKLREAGDAFAHAAAHAGELGAGSLVTVGRFDLAEFAIVLEPEEPLATARRAFYAGMVALARALAALAPPEKPIAIAWPDAVYIDGGLVGGGRLAWPADAAEGAVPAWLVFGATIRTSAASEAAIALDPFATALEAEGFDDPTAAPLIEGFARHLMALLDRWQETGFAPLAADYATLLKPDSLRPDSLRPDSLRPDSLKPDSLGPVEHRKLLPALATPSWLDPASGALRR